MRPVALDFHTERQWIRIAATREADTAERWREAVEAAGVSSEVHIEDPREALPGTAGVPEFVLGSGFAYGIWVPRAERLPAVRALIDAGWDGRHGSVDAETPSTRTIVGGALLALGAALLVVIVRVAFT